LLRATVASAGNDHRLGANEAPPAIISIYLGDMLADVFEQLRKSGSAKSSKKGGVMQLGVDSLPVLPKDAGDRNRTSPFAFTGNKFEFRAVGSSFSIAGPLVALNTIVADSIEFMVERIEAEMKGKKGGFNAALEVVVKEILQKHSRIIFNGNGYSEAWHKEAAKRGLLNLRTTPDALPEIASPKTVEVFERQGVLSKRELVSREEIYTHSYVLSVNTESKLVSQIGRTTILPVALQYARQLAETAAAIKSAGGKSSSKMLSQVVSLTNDLESALDSLDKLRAHEASDTHAAARHAVTKVLPAMLVVREAADALEGLVDDALWPLPSYQELLFLR
jgi:glutamine synthetase